MLTLHIRICFLVSCCPTDITRGREDVCEEVCEDVCEDVCGRSAGTAKQKGRVRNQAPEERCNTNPLSQPWTSCVDLANHKLS